MLNRRRWLQVGVVGAVALGTAGLVARWQYGSAHDAPRLEDRASAWTPEAAELVAALAPVMLGDACKTPADTQRLVQGVQAAVQSLSPSAQRDVGELFALLNIAPARGVLAGVWRPWSEASSSEIESFLQRWRHSRLALLQAGYHALHDLILAAWYADPASWPDIGYPGPPLIPASTTA